MFGFITFRAALAIIFSLLISLVFGKKIIAFLVKKQVGETIRDLGLEGQIQKAGTPTMGGLIIILATVVPVLLFAKLHNIYVILLLVTTLWMGAIGFLDDYIKKFRNNKEGLQGKFKVMGQVGLGLIVGVSLYFHPEVTMKKELSEKDKIENVSELGVQYKRFGDEVKSTQTTVPFLKNNQFDYSDLITWISPSMVKYTAVILSLQSSL